MKQNYSEETIKKILGKKPVTSPLIEKRIDDVYESLRSGGKRKRKSWRAGIIGLGSIAAAFFILIAIGIMNPVWASELPLIGSIFERLEEKVVFKGSYSEKSMKLDEGKEEPTAGKKYVQESGGITITISEAYAEKLALYLSVTIENQEAFPDEFNYSENVKGATIDTNELLLYSESTWDFTKSGGRKMDSYIYTATKVDGVFEDPHTFTGLIRIDLSNFDYMPSDAELEAAGITDSFEAPPGQSIDEVIQSKFPDAGTPIEIPDKFTYSLHISELFGDLLETEPVTGVDDETGESYVVDVPKTKSYKGTWDFTFDITLDSSNTQVIELNETYEDGLGIATVTRTSEEIAVEMIDHDQASFGEYVVAICDADGNALETKDGNMYVYSTYGRDTSKITIYICDEDDYMNEIKGENLSSNLPDGALYKKEIAFKK